MTKMNLKLLIYRMRLRGIPVYCILLLVVYVNFRYVYKTRRVELMPRHLRKYVRFGEGYAVMAPKLTPRELNALSTTVDVLNFEREVFNQKRFGPVHPDTNMIVVQVHRDAERLQYLIISLAQVHYIQSTLVIFSHSFFDERINKMIMSITFCRYMQIFYPFSNQLYPSRFPGIDPEDCLYSVQVGKYCSSRDARRTEHKHHWWWKAYFVFNNLDWSRNYKGTVIFLEEDNYVLPDLLYMLRYAKKSITTALLGVNVMAFGRPYSRDVDYDLFIVDTWRPPFDIALAFNKTVWKKISALSSYFCTYDDLSWSFSLLNLFSKFKAGHADMVACLAPRVFSTSMYSSGRDAIEKIYWQTKGAPFFPTSVKAVMVYSATGRVDSVYNLSLRGNGGWSDIRDHLLCLDPFTSTERTTDETADVSTTPPTFGMSPQFNYSAIIVQRETDQH